MIVLKLPVPPSVNAMYANSKYGRGRGRFKTKAYKQWIDAADGALMEGWRAWKGKDAITGGAKLSIQLPTSMRGDISNRIKAVEDFLVARNFTADDRHNNRVSVERADVDCCIVTIEPCETV